MDLVTYLKGSYGSHGSTCDPPSLDFEIGGRGTHSAIVFLNVFFFVVVGWSKLLMFTEPQTSKNHQKWRGSALKPLVLGKAVSCAVWEGLEGRREEIREK